MSRPPPQILKQKTIGASWRQITITAGEGLWAVVYQDQPFGYISEIIDIARAKDRKYPKTVFPHPGHAENLARKLNHWFETEDFSVRKIL